MANRLAKESSPYLLQHAENPVDWWPWCDEAFELAKSENKPIFLSVGYSACHWCHVMEHESFENEAIADFLNQHFVSIKVDREERPDVDHIYMQAVMALSGHGGWPLSAFLTPDQKFFFGGTYWPPQASRGMPGFDHVLQSVISAYQERRATIEQQAEQVSELLEKQSARSDFEDTNDLLSRTTIGRAVNQMQKSFDVNDGGFGSAPKFPHPMDLGLLIRAMDYADQLGEQSAASIRQMIEVTLNKMAYGGIHDHLGGGFARYSVDSKWLVPHFEKMLYDNAQLTSVYLEAHRVTGREFFLRVAEKTIDYMLGDLRDDQGGFHSTEDADSEGVEGKFYVWSRSEVLELLGDEVGQRFCEFYDVTENGNFEGQNILNVKLSFGDFAEQHGLEKAAVREEMKTARQALLKARNQRVRPGKDDKVIVSWNALAIDALAKACVVLDGRPSGLDLASLEAARSAADFVWNELRDERGRLMHTWRHGTGKLNAYLDDYAYMVNALVSLYEADFDLQWLERACQLAETMIEHFADEQAGFFFTSDDHESLVVRIRDLQDSSVPSGNSMAANALLRLGRLCGRDDWSELGVNTIVSAGALIERAPSATGQMLIALDLHLRPNQQQVLVIEQDDERSKSIVAQLRQQARFGKSLIVANSSQLNAPGPLRAILDGKTAVEGQPTLYECESYTCAAPLVGQEAIKASLATEQVGL